MALIFLQYIGRLKLPHGMPAGFLAVVTGTVLAWALGRMDAAVLMSALDVQPEIPRLFLPELIGATGSKYMLAFLPVIIPMGLFNLIGSLQNLESAEAAGDRFETRPSLLANGLGSLCAACLGSAFPTTIYIGHPGWKALGARAGYSVLNGAFVTLVALTGTLMLSAARTGSATAMLAKPAAAAASLIQRVQLMAVFMLDSSLCLFDGRTIPPLLLKYV